MKKLMIAAAAAAMVGGVYAGDIPQVYDFTATLKTTECSNKTAKDVCTGDTVYYRVQKTQKLYGKFWGCECKVIACPDNYGVDIPDDFDASSDAYQSYVFWTSTKAAGAILGANMEWDFIQRVGKNGKNVEGSFDIELFEDVDNGTQFAYLYGAGYGTAVISCDEDNYIKSMSGNIAGWWNTTAKAVSSVCKYCGEEPNCEVYAFCDCADVNDEAAALFGSFTIKYNASQVKSLKAGKDMTTVAFKKNEAVLATFVAKAAADDDDDDEELSAKDKAIAAYKEAKEAYVAATNTYAEAKAAYDDLVADKSADHTTCEKGAKIKTDSDNADKAVTDALTALNKTIVGDELKKLAAAETAVESREDAIAAKEAEINAETDKDKIAALTAQLKILKEGDKDNDKATEENKASLAELQQVSKQARAACKDAKALAKYDTAKATYDSALTTQETANKALETWKNGDEKTEGSYLKVLKDADDKEDAAYEAMYKAQIQLAVSQTNCKSAGGDKDCE